MTLTCLLSGFAMPAFSTTELNTVAVYGHNDSGFSPDFLSGHHQRIEREEFTRKFILLPELLGQQSGIDIQSIGGIGQYSSPVIRGSSGQQVLVFWDGLQINSLNGGGADLSKISLSQAETVDIYRSIAPVELSSSAVGGIIHIRSRSLAGEIINQGEAHASRGSYGTQQYTLSQNFGSAESQWLLSGDLLQADNDFTYLEPQPVDNPQQPGYEKRYNNKSQQYQWLIKGRQALGDSYLNIAVQSGRGKRGLTSRINFPANHAQLKTDSDSLQLNWQKTWGKEQKTEISGNIYRQDQLYDDRDSNIGLGAQLNRYITDGQKFQINHYMCGDNFNAVFTSRLQQEETATDFRLLNESEKEQQCLNGNGCETTYKRQQLDNGGRLQYTLNSLELTAQFSHIRLSDKDLQRLGNNRQDNVNTWSIGIDQRLPSGIIIYANIAHQVRLPTTNELFGDRGTSMGNPTLLPEQAEHYETGLRFQNSKIALTTSLYLRNISDAIISESDSRGVIHFDNLGRTRHTGLEQDIRWNIWSALSLSASITLQSNEIIEYTPIPYYEGNQAAGYSQFSGYFSASWTKNNWDFSVGNYRQSDGYYNNSNLLEKDAENSWNASAGYQRKNWRVSMNVTDATSNSARDYPYYPEPGRMFFLRAHYQW